MAKSKGENKGKSQLGGGLGRSTNKIARPSSTTQRPTYK